MSLSWVARVVERTLQISERRCITSLMWMFNRQRSSSSLVIASYYITVLLLLLCGICGCPDSLSLSLVLVMLPFHFASQFDRIALANTSHKHIILIRKNHQNTITPKIHPTTHKHAHTNIILLYIWGHRFRLCWRACFGYFKLELVTRSSSRRDDFTLRTHFEIL